MHRMCAVTRTSFAFSWKKIQIISWSFVDHRLQPDMSASSNQVTQAAALLRRASEMLSASGRVQPSVPASIPPTPSTGATMVQPSVPAFIPPTPSTSATRPETSSVSNFGPVAVQEHRRLFNRQMRIQPYGTSRGRTTQRARSSAVPKEKTITRTFVCMAEKDQCQVPSTGQKLTLKANGLGEKKIELPVTGTADTVKTILQESFMPLKSCGGFELLRTKEKSRTELTVLSFGACSVDAVRCFGTGRIYIRPIQVDIALTDDPDWGEEYDDCLKCNMPVQLCDMRKHMDTCGHDDLDDVPSMLDGPAEPHSSNTINNSNEGNNDGTESTDTLEHTNVIEKLPYETHLENALKETLHDMATCDDPVSILRHFRTKLHRGRSLDLESDSDICEGETSDIFVSRFDIFQTGMDEIMRSDITDFSIPLEVTYHGEAAQDLGGPRRQFLGSIMHEIRDRLFVDQGEKEYILTEDMNAITGKYYYGAGLYFGYSLLQGGPLPTFMAENQIQRILQNDGSASLNRSEDQFRAGLEKFGLVKLVHEKPSLIFLFRKTAVLPLTYSKLVKILAPTFSEEGSNRRQEEDKTYSLFLNYLKEVTAGRRADGKVSLENILKFTSGCDNEPVLGFQLKPTIDFRAMHSAFPMSNTCINRLTLPIGEIVPENKEELFSFFDFAFLNDYFGII